MSEERDLTRCKKFLKDYPERPYTYDRFGQVIVILCPGLRSVRHESAPGASSGNHSG